MPTALASSLRMSLSMTRGHDVATAPPADDEGSPLGYLYATDGVCDHTDPAPEVGHYDPDTQTWVDPDGAITAGVYTKTRTACGCWKTDDACM
jgi:hypothetical protein